MPAIALKNAIRIRTESLIQSLIYTGLLIAVYFESHRMMVLWWKREDYNYCYLIPLVVFYLLWEKRKALKKVPAEPTWIGLLPVVFGLLLFWMGELGGEYYTMYLSSWLVLLGLCWLHLGWQKLKVILFPICVILTMFPPPNYIYFNLSLRLKLISSKLGVWTLQMLGKSAYREGNVIDLGFTQLQVVDACNGLRYLFPLIVLAILVAYFYRSAWWKKTLVVLSAIPISIFVNGFRIASVGLLYPIWGPQVAEGFFHDFSGWAIFMISLFVLLIEMWLLNILIPEKGFRKPAAQVQSVELINQRTGAGSAALIGAWRSVMQSPKFLVAVLLMMVTAGIAQTVNFRETVPISRPFSQFPLRLGQWHGQLQTMDQKFIDGLNFSDYIIVNYSNGSEYSVNFYTAYYESQRKGESIHSPASCLPGGGWVLHESGTVDIATNNRDEPYVRVNRAFIQKGDEKQLSYFWFPMRGQVATNMWQIKLFNFWDALTRQRTDGALVRLITTVGKEESLQKAETRLQTFMTEILPVLNEFLPQ